MLAGNDPGPSSVCLSCRHPCGKIRHGSYEKRRLPVEPLAGLLIGLKAQQGYSQVELARRLGISERRLRHILKNQDEIQLRTADKLCLALDIPLSEVYPL
jgi:DNA-binding XRE family transcriptional regulator